jgi:hypothetical protein
MVLAMASPFRPTDTRKRVPTQFRNDLAFECQNIATQSESLDAIEAFCKIVT